MTEHTAENDAPESDPADYGYADLPRGHYGVRIIPNTPPELTTCLACGRVATDHTPGRFSIYGTCPISPGEEDG